MGKLKEKAIGRRRHSKGLNIFWEQKRDKVRGQRVAVFGVRQKKKRKETPGA